MTFEKTLGPNGTVITKVSWAAGSLQGAVQWEAAGVFLRLHLRKGAPKGASLKTMKIENGTENQLFIKFGTGTL